MGDLAKLKVGLGQPRIVEGSSSRNAAAVESLVDRALDAGADVLVLPSSFGGPRDVQLIGLNDSRVDVVGDVVVLDACGETYRIGLGHAVPGCDFCVVNDARPYTVAGVEPLKGRSTVVVRPVGIRERGKKVLAFDGGSCAFGADGKLLARLRDDFCEDFDLVSLAEGGQVQDTCDTKALQAVVSALRCFDDQVLSWCPKWVIGLSGGLDSSVVAALLVEAFGADRVIGYNLATRFNSGATKSNAASLAADLGIEMHNGSIEEQVVSVGNTLVQYGYPPDALNGLVLENVQARTRGGLLSTFAAVEGGVVANNGNRVEGALGYATLYGDSIGAIAPIGDLTKVQLFDVARGLNDRKGHAVVPENLLPVLTDTGFEWETMPSAELASGQRDPMKWFYHDWLVGRLLGDGLPDGATRDDAVCWVMERYLDDRLSGQGVSKWVAYYGLDEPAAFLDDLDWVVRSMAASAFKRIQAPPTVTMASPASVAAGPESQTPQDPSQRQLELRRRIAAL